MGIQVRVKYNYVISKTGRAHGHHFQHITPTHHPPRRLQGLTKLLADNAPEAMREQKFENYFGRKIAVDASMHIYSFLVRTALHCRCCRGGITRPPPPLSLTTLHPLHLPQVVVGRQGDQLLSNESGEVTRHVDRFFLVFIPLPSPVVLTSFLRHVPTVICWECSIEPHACSKQA